MSEEIGITEEDIHSQQIRAMRLFSSELETRLEEIKKENEKLLEALIYLTSALQHAGSEPEKLLPALINGLKTIDEAGVSKMKLWTNGFETIIADSAEKAKSIYSEESLIPMDDCDDFYEETNFPFKFYWEDAPKGEEEVTYESVDDMVKDFPCNTIIFSTEW
ncbi:MAG: hypothetical protein JXR78_01755 [Victivallales bacterium]|nr:hypothetical protein [Victivallales bacterium]